MALDNLISLTLSDEEISKIEQALAMLNEVLQDKAINLTPDERRQYGSIADRNRVLVDKCKMYMEQNPHTVPGILDKAEFDRDYKARQQLEIPLKQLMLVIEKMRDTKTLLDHDNYHAAVAYYRYIKYLASENEPGTTGIYKDLSLHYKRPKSPADTPPENPEGVDNSSDKD
ncbi:MAG: hypothetical protein CSB06_02180 [Bacteroidia bacterium]|nr:MAG: hypothetical protein CSB06_02180 [Bacteroidia bacterium]